MFNLSQYDVNAGILNLSAGKKYAEADEPLVLVCYIKIYFVPGRLRKSTHEKAVVQ